MMPVEKQMSIYDFLADDSEERDGTDDRALKTAIGRGSGYENGQTRIYAAYRCMSEDDFIVFLAQEFGTGGHSMQVDGKTAFADYNYRGIKIAIWKENTEFHFSWKTVAEAYKRMIQKWEFPDDRTRSLIDSRTALKKPYPRMKYDLD